MKFFTTIASLSLAASAAQDEGSSLLQVQDKKIVDDEDCMSKKCEPKTGGLDPAPVTTPAPLKPVRLPPSQFNVVPDGCKGFKNVKEDCTNKDLFILKKNTKGFIAPTFKPDQYGSDALWATEKVQDSDWKGTCVAYVATGGGTCKTFCESNGMKCVRAMDDAHHQTAGLSKWLKTGGYKPTDCTLLPSGHRRQSQRENGCNQKWGTQMCACANLVTTMPVKPIAQPVVKPMPAVIEPVVIKPVPKPVNAAQWCGEQCLAKNLCCNDPKVGSNQMISCAQACLMRSQGVAQAEMLSSNGGICNRKGSSGCSLVSKRKNSFGFCSRCKDLKKHCPHGVQSAKECDVGASLWTFTSEATDTFVIVTPVKPPVIAPAPPVKSPVIAPAPLVQDVEEVESTYKCDGEKTAETEAFSAYWEYHSCGHFGNDYNKGMCKGAKCPEFWDGHGGIIQFPKQAETKYPGISKKVNCLKAKLVHMVKSKAFTTKRIYNNLGKVNTAEGIQFKDEKCGKCSYLWHAQYQCIQRG